MNTQINDGLYLSSSLTINYSLETESVVKSIESTIDQHLHQPISLQDGKIILEIKRSGKIKLENSVLGIIIYAPFHIKAIKNMSIGTAISQGVVSLKFLIDLSVDEEWNLKTQTSLTNYIWLEVPRTNYGIISFSILNRANSLIDSNKSKLAFFIDESFQNNFNLKEFISEWHRKIVKPYPLNQHEVGWVKLRITACRWNIIDKIETRMNGLLHLDILVDYSMAKPKADMTSPLPILTLDKNKDSRSELRMHAQISYEILGLIIRNQLADRAISLKTKKINISDVQISFDEKKLILQCTIDGSYCGELLIKGIPEVVESGKRLVVNEMELEMIPQNILHKPLFWLLKKKLLEKLVSILDIDIEKLAQSFNEKFMNHLNGMISAEVLRTNTSITSAAFLKFEGNTKSFIGEIIASGIVEMKFNDWSIFSDN